MQPGNLPLSITRGIIFGPIVMVCKDVNGAPVNLTNWIPYAEVRDDPDSSLILDLQPAVTNAVGGEVTIPRLDDEDTRALPEDQDSNWDLIFQLPTGERVGPYISGSFTINSIITQPPDSE